MSSGRQLALGLALGIVVSGAAGWWLSQSAAPAASPSPISGLPETTSGAASTPKTGQTERWTRLLSAQQTDQLSSELSSALSTRDTRPVFTWLKSLPSGPARDNVILGLLDQVSVRSRLDLALWISERHVRQDIICAALADLTVSDASAAQEWVSKVTPEVATPSVCQAAIALSWATYDPLRAAEFVSLHMPEGVDQLRAAVGVVQRWAQKDPNECAKWIATMDDPALRQNAQEELHKIGAK